MRGTVLAFPGTRILAKPLAALVYLVGWQGKVVDRPPGFCATRSRRCGCDWCRRRSPTTRAGSTSRDCVLLDYSQTSLVAKFVRDEIRLVGPSLYLGVVWLWRRRMAWFTLRSTGRRAPRPAPGERDLTCLASSR